jgi:preprotein translocase subunit YajC
VQILIVLVLGLVVMYVLLIRPQRQRQAEHQARMDRLGVGEDVLTTGGIYGTVVEVDGDDVVVEIAQDVTVHMTRRGIAAILPPEEDEDEMEEDDADDVEDDDADEVPAAELEEAAVTGGEESVTSASERPS